MFLRGLGSRKLTWRKKIDSNTIKTITIQNNSMPSISGFNELCTIFFHTDNLDFIFTSHIFDMCDNYPELKTIILPPVDSMQNRFFNEILVAVLKTAK